VRGFNNESFARTIASLSGFIKKHQMDIKILTIVSTQSFAFKAIHDKNSFSHKLLARSENFKKHMSAFSDLETIATKMEHEQNVKLELISNLNI